MSAPMMKAEWLRVDDQTEGMNVPGGCVLRCWNDGRENMMMVYVPMVAVVKLDGIPYLSSTLPAVMGEMMTRTAQVSEEIIRKLDRSRE